MVICHEDAYDVTHAAPFTGRSVHLDRTASGKTNKPVDPDRISSMSRGALATRG
jgi:hypothetical protein